MTFIKHQTVRKHLFQVPAQSFIFIIDIQQIDVVTALTYVGVTIGFLAPVLSKSVVDLILIGKLTLQKCYLNFYFKMCSTKRNGVTNEQLQLIQRFNKKYINTWYVS